MRSKSRPDQTKLVGRISIDLADIINNHKYANFQELKMNYCSVDGSLTFKINFLNQRDCNLSIKDLDRSSFTYIFFLI